MPEAGKYEFFYDDGETYEYLDGKYIKIKFRMDCFDDRIKLDFNRGGSYVPGDGEIKFYIPESEKRKTIINGREHYGIGGFLCGMKI